MTMRIKIENCDATRKLKITTLDYSLNDGRDKARASQTQTIEPGQTAEVWAYIGRDFRLEEEP